MMTDPMRRDAIVACDRDFRLARGVPRQGRLRLELEVNRVLRATPAPLIAKPERVVFDGIDADGCLCGHIEGTRELVTLTVKVRT